MQISEVIDIKLMLLVIFKKDGSPSITPYDQIYGNPVYVNVFDKKTRHFVVKNKQRLVSADTCIDSRRSTEHLWNQQVCRSWHLPWRDLVSLDQWTTVDGSLPLTTSDACLFTSWIYSPSLLSKRSNSWSASLILIRLLDRVSPLVNVNGYMMMLW